MTRVSALLRKELTDMSRHPGIFVPACMAGFVALLMPFVLAIVIPAATGEPLSKIADFSTTGTMEGHHTAAGLEGEAAAQSWIFRQFLILLALSPVAAAMSVAAWSIVGEKQARTLEPLLATPLTTFELLCAKTLSALLPALVLSTALFTIYVGAVAALGAHGVAASLLTAAPLSVMFLLAPLASLAALQLAVCMSSRTNDARSAQQLGALVIFPLAGLLVLQLMGVVALGLHAILVMAAALLVFNVILVRVAIALFDRESILTRWK